MRICKKHVGMKLAYRGCNRASESVLVGEVKSVQRGMVEVVSNLIVENDGRTEYSREGFRTLLEANDVRIVGIMKGN